MGELTVSIFRFPPLLVKRTTLLKYLKINGLKALPTADG